MCRVSPESVRGQNKDCTPADNIIPYRGRGGNVKKKKHEKGFIPGQRLFAGVPSGQQGRVLAGSDPD